MTIKDYKKATNDLRVERFLLKMQVVHWLKLLTVSAFDRGDNRTAFVRGMSAMALKAEAIKGFCALPNPPPPFKHGGVVLLGKGGEPVIPHRFQ